MKRSQFISSLIPLGAMVSTISKAPIPNLALVIPPYLKKGDTIGITCPAGFVTRTDIEPAVIKLTEWGYRLQIGNTVGKKDFSFSGTVAERYLDLQQMLDDKNIKAILCARGGYGTINIIDELNFKLFAKYPKWIIGFSDITILHSHLNRNCGIASIHSKMCNSFPTDWNLAEEVQKQSIESIHQCLAGEKMTYSSLPNINNKAGMAKGILVGGNLKTLETLAGTSSDLITKDKILFVEDTGEYLYSIDRMFWNLKRTGKLTKLAGLIIGGFKIRPDEAGEAFGKTLEEIVLEKIKEYDYPVCFDFPVGHQKNNFALKCGVTHTLLVDANACTLTAQT